MKIQATATVVTALSLTLIILLTQSIRYLELVISSDASPIYFLVMIGLAVPKFLETILPLAFAIGTIYAANRMMNDREMVIMSAAGAAHRTVAKPFIILAVILMGIQFALSGWLAPMTVERLQIVRGEVKSHYATLMFREGVFNELSNGLMAYVEKRNGLNEIQNILIHDERGNLNEGKHTTILAKRGIINLTDENQQLLVYDGTQYMQEPGNPNISRLDFAQYTLDIPVQESVIATRWKEPDERILQKLIIPDDAPEIDLRNKGEFVAEFHKRFSSPFLYMSYGLCILAFLLLSAWNRRNTTLPLVKAGACIVVIQAGYVVLFNEAIDTSWLSGMLYAIAIIPSMVMGARLYRA